MTAHPPSCPICFYDYNATTHIPFIGICGHDLCQQCVGQVERCPICMAGGSFAQKNKNYGMISLISILKENGGVGKEREQILEEKRKLNDEKVSFQKEKEQFGEEKRIFMQEKQKLNDGKNLFNMEKMAFENGKADFEREKRTFEAEVRKLTAEKNAILNEKELWNRSKQAFEEEKKSLRIDKEKLNIEKRILQEQKQRFELERMNENSQLRKEQEINTLVATTDAQLFVTPMEQLSIEMVGAMEDVRQMKRAIYSLNMGGVQPARQELFRNDLKARISCVMDAVEGIKACAGFTAIELTKVTSAVEKEMQGICHTDTNYSYA